MRDIFKPGDMFDHAGMEYRVLRGDRCDGDMVIEFRLPGSEWYRPLIATTLILADFKCQVEENNYGKNGKVKPGKGREYLLEKIGRACRLVGWREVAEEISGQRALKRSAWEEMWARPLSESNPDAV